MATDIYFAPDTGDIPNWGCRIMSLLYRNLFAADGGRIRWRSGSSMFSDPLPGIPEPKSRADLERCAEAARRGQLLPELAGFAPEIDLAFMNGENFIRPGARKGKVLLLMAYLLKVVHGRRCVLANLCLDLAEPGLAEMVATVFPLMDEVQVRDARSAAVLSALLPDLPFRRVADIAWLVTPAPVESWRSLAQRPGHFDAWPDQAEGFDPGRDYLTVCASSAFAQPGVRWQDAVPAFVRLCRDLQSIAPVLLVAPCQVDAAILRHVQDELQLPLLGLHVPVQQAIDVLAQARVHVGGRWHPGIFAATGGTPLVGLGANSHKMHSLIDELQPGAPMFDPLRLDGQRDAIVAEAQRQADAGEPLRARIRAHAASLRAPARDGAAVLGRILSMRH